jgi:adenine-specific DNA-methyltransferase
MVIKYLGSKRRLLPVLAGLLDELGPLSTAADLFAGTTRVGRLLKRRGLHVHSNDTSASSEVLGRAAIATDAREVDRAALAALLDDLQHTPPGPGWFTRLYAEEARYLHPDNAGRIEAIRARIERELPDEPLRSLALASLLVAADRVDSTTGLQMAYLKSWAPRALQPLRLALPELLDGPGSVSRQDAALCARELPAVDLAYLDPPYNQHSYLGNYHVWETLVLFDEPETYGVARKRADVRTRKSPWNSRRRIRGAFAELLDAVDARWIVVSFSDEGFLAAEEIETLLATRGPVRTVEVPDHPRYVGARIGIHNPAGEKVGTVGHLTNTECLFVVETS